VTNLDGEVLGWLVRARPGGSLARPGALRSSSPTARSGAVTGALPGALAGVVAGCVPGIRARPGSTLDRLLGGVPLEGLAGRGLAWLGGWE
jgi:hypothetical protein